MKRSLQLGFLAVAVAAGWLLGNHRHAWRVRGDAATFNTGPTIEQLQRLARLVTLRVEVADVLETHLDGHTGGMKVALLVKGDLLLGVDLSQGRFESVNEASHTAQLVLPQPQATSPRLDHERTKVFTLSQSGLWQIAPGGGQTSGDVIDHAYRDAQRSVVAAGDDPALIARAREHAEAVLAAFFWVMGWKVAVRWAT